jgi:hypothetical protein
MRRVTVITCCGLALAAAPAAAAGGPVSPVQGGAGVSTPGGEDSFIAVGAGRGETVVMRVRRADASVRRSAVIAGSFGVPGVTYDGINTGLSADGGTLVLAQSVNRFPARTTKIQVLDARTLRPRRQIVLPSMVTVDAISPNGRWMYFVDYKDGGISQYDVRAYDLQRGRLLRKPIIDPRDPAEKLQGVPLTRVQSAEGRWAYTLYSGEKPFIHALDTEGRTAVCIDVPSIPDSNLGSVKLALSGDRLTVESGGTPLALVDLKSFKVTKPAAAAATAAPRPPAKPAQSGDGGPPWLLWTLPLAAFAVLAVLARRRTARHAAARSSLPT